MQKQHIIFLIYLISINCLVEEGIYLELIFYEVVTEEFGKKGTLLS